jgi:hypothetical protein
MEVTPEKLTVTIDEPFPFEILYPYSHSLDLITTISLLQCNHSIDPYTSREWVPAEEWTYPQISNHQETSDKVRVMVKDMELPCPGMYWIKICGWVPEVITGPKWECFVPLTVQSRRRKSSVNEAAAIEASKESASATQ